jgi:hypothetical protein
MRIVFIYILFLIPSLLFSQRQYADSSVLASGVWAKIGITKEGMYQIDLNFLRELGLNTSSIQSAKIQLRGNGGAMLPENNAAKRIDDLAEIAIEVQDGKDGLLNGNDFLLFYAPGPHQWFSDSTDRSFFFENNLYSDTAYYFINLDGNTNGKRVQLSSIHAAPTVQIDSYTDYYAYEKDLYNILHSGKEWLGESFSTGFGGTTTRSYSLNWPGLVLNEPIRIFAACGARSVGKDAFFNIRINEELVDSIGIKGVSGNFLSTYVNTASIHQQHFVKQNNLTVSFNFKSDAPTAQGWLNRFVIAGKRTLAFTDNQFLRFRDWRSVTPNTSGQFNINNSADNTSVWDVTNILAPIKMNTSFAGSSTKFINDVSEWSAYIAFTPTHYATPIALGKIAPQNIHQIKSVHGIIVTHPSLLQEAERLAAFHLKQYGFKDAVLTTQQIYHEFSSGSPDPTAIRDCIKMIADKSANTKIKPSYVVLFGNGTFDPKNRIVPNYNLVPVYESKQSFDPLTSFMSDDFYGLITDSADINLSEQFTPLSIAVGRISAKNSAEARLMVNKIIAYHTNKSFGAWRNEMILLADDQDNNLHLNDAESVAAIITQTNPLVHQQKIYLDAYPLKSNPSGASYPGVNEAIVNSILKGALMFNYSGHGNYHQLTEEAVFSEAELNRFNNANKLPLFITASCDFAPFDDPTKQSLGEQLLFKNENGGIGLLTTTRLVFASSNRIMNMQYVQQAITRQADGSYLALGEAVRIAKNNTSANGGDVLNTRKFTLLGDPAMQLAFPTSTIKINTLNGNPFNDTDSIAASGKYTMEGTVLSAEGEINTQFNGIVEITLYDKPQVSYTLGNTLQSTVAGYLTQNGNLYKGKASVIQGRFNFTFVLPKEMYFKPGEGRISLYGYTDSMDAAGTSAIKISGSKNIVSADDKGPEIQLYLNDTLFIQGGITHENPILIAHLADSSGINASGNIIGHDITLVIDGDEQNKIILNDFFTHTLNSYQKGTLSFQLPTLKEGPHQLKVKAWDMLNNSGEARLSFEVFKKEELKISAIKNFPNPFKQSTRFSFEHNQPKSVLQVEIMILGSDGNQIKSIKNMIHTQGSRNVEIFWNGESNSGRKLVNGLYFYRIIVSANGQQVQSAGQILLL